MSQRFWYFSIFSFSLSIILLSPSNATSKIIAVFSILFAITISGLLSISRIYMPHYSLWLTFLLTVWGLCGYQFSDFSILHFSHNFQQTILATLSCLLLYSLPFWAFTHGMTNLFTCLTTHSTRRWINTFINVVFDIVCFYCLFLCRAYQGFTWYFYIIFSQPEPWLFFAYAFRRISNKLPIHLFLFPVFYPFLIQQFFWDTLF